MEPCLSHCISVVVQFYLWFKFFLSFVVIIIIMIKLIIIHYHTQKQRKIKFEPRIKLNHNISTKRTCFSGFGALEQMCYGDLLGRALKQVPNVML